MILKGNNFQTLNFIFQKENYGINSLIWKNIYFKNKFLELFKKISS